MSEARDATPEALVAALCNDVALLRAAIAARVVGQREVLDGVLTCLLTGGHALLEGVPGVGKTLIVRSVAEAVDLRFARIQFTPDLMPSDIVGVSVLRDDGAGGRRFEFERGPVFAHVVLADEVNRATPRTQSALLEVMQEQTVTVAGATHHLEPPYCVLATQNPLEMEGTYPLPEAQLDRFLLKLKVPFPSHDDLQEILARTTREEPAPLARVLSRARLLAMREIAGAVVVDAHVRTYAVRLLEATHPERSPGLPRIQRFVRYGASPRGGQALLRAAKVRAVLAGRFAASVDDVRAVAHGALAHRIILNFEGVAEGLSSDALLDDLLAHVPER